MNSLREQVLINQFVVASGLSHDQAKQLLQASNWQFETALSLFLQDSPSTGNNHNNNLAPTNHMTQMKTPANTPATPPNFPETLLQFTKLCTAMASVKENVESAARSRHSSTSGAMSPPAKTISSTTRSNKLDSGGAATSTVPINIAHHKAAPN